MADSKAQKVPFKKKNGPITLEVTSGYSTIGSFVLAHAKKGEYKFIEFGKEPKIIDDDIRDSFLIPIDLSEIENYRVIIIGKYKPGPGHSQVRVNYTFFQEKMNPSTTKIEKNIDEEFERFVHKFEFEEQ